MNESIAAALLTSLLERIDRDKTIGTVSSLEREALQRAVRALSGEPPEAPAANAPTPMPAAPTAAPVPTEPQVAPAATLPKVQLVLNALDQEKPNDPDVMLCLDFGTAMSKAFAQSLDEEHVELALGRAAGGRSHALPSSVFISDDGKAYFGQEAIDLSQDLGASGRQRLDSIKGWLSLRKEGNLDSEPCVLPPELNPTPVRLTQGDLMRIYLAYLTDVATTALTQHDYEGHPIGRYVKRRFARPCWPDEKQTAWADALMRSMLCEAQVLADTFSGRWRGGIPVTELKAAIEQVKRLRTGDPRTGPQAPMHRASAARRPDHRHHAQRRVGDPGRDRAHRFHRARGRRTVQDLAALVLSALHHQGRAAAGGVPDSLHHQLLHEHSWRQEGDFGQSVGSDHPRMGSPVAARSAQLRPSAIGLSRRV